MLLGLQVALRLKGVSDLVKKLAEIDRKVARQALRKAVVEAEKPILKAEKAAVPTDSKSLKKALGHKERVYRSGVVVVGIIGPRKDAKGKPGKFRRIARSKKRGRDELRNPVKYAHLVEKGTRPHSLSKGDRLARKGRKGGGSQSSGRKHPGAKAHPFVGPAKRKNVRTVRTIMAGVLLAALKEARKR